MSLLRRFRPARPVWPTVGDLVRCNVQGCGGHSSILRVTTSIVRTVAPATAGHESDAHAIADAPGYVRCATCGGDDVERIGRVVLR